MQQFKIRGQRYQFFQIFILEICRVWYLDAIGEKQLVHKHETVVYKQLILGDQIDYNNCGSGEGNNPVYKNQ